MTLQSIHRTAMSVVAVLLAVLSVSCGDVARQGRSPAQVVINSIVGIPGDSPTSRGNSIISDVKTQITTPDPCTTGSPCDTWINDSGEVVFSLILKDPGQPGVTAAPSSLNSVTITRYHVKYTRADGRNTQGVDLPYEFDSALTVTVPETGNVTAGFDLVRHNAKQEQPLVSLVCNSFDCPPMISTIADITFYGHDQAGNEVSVKGSIGVTFGDVIRAR